MVHLQQQQAGLEKNFRNLPEFQEILSDMARRELFRRRIRDNFLFNHHRERTRRMAFMYLKENATNKLYERRALRHANLVMTKRAKMRLFQAWRGYKTKEKGNRLLHAMTRECELQAEEHKKLGHKMISQLEQELEKKEIEYIQEERKLNQLNEKFSVLKAADKTVNVLQKHDKIPEKARK